MSIQNEMPGYNEMNRFLNQQGTGLTPAEMHGLISGMICGGNNDSSWQPLLHDLTNEGLAFGHELAQALRKMHAATSDALEDDGFLFQLYLPEGDDVSVFDRADALAGWVNHFLLGLGVTQPKLDKVTGETVKRLTTCVILRSLVMMRAKIRKSWRCRSKRSSNMSVLRRCYVMTLSRANSRPRRKCVNRRYTKKKRNGGHVMTQQEYQRRRQALLAQMQPGSAALIFAAPEATRSADSEYPYRQSSDFWYFTGFNEPEAVLVLIKSDDTHNHSVLFNRVRDLTAEIWFGRRLGQDAAPEKLGVDRALAFSEINQQLFQLLNGLDVVYHAQGEYAYADEIVLAALEKLRKGSRQNLTAPATMTDWRPIVHEMRLFKSPEEIAVLRRAGEISALAHIRAMEKCRPGMFEYQLEGEIHHEFNRHGARYPSYNTIVGSGENGCILHYTENESEMRDGDLVLIDAGCEYKGYAGDITRTFPVNGKFTPAQREIYDIVLESLETSLRLFRPGTSIQEVTGEVVRIMITGLVKLGILQGEVDQLIAENAHRPFFMHGLSHWLGLDVHDVGVYGPDRSRTLEPGMVLTVEPGLYIAPDADVPEAYRGIGVRIEDDIVITETGNENLTAGVVKKADDIEALMAAARQQ